jgi:hypothetical protein
MLDVLDQLLPGKVAPGFRAAGQNAASGLNAQ